MASLNYTPGGAGAPNLGAFSQPVVGGGSPRTETAQEAKERREAEDARDLREARERNNPDRIGTPSGSEVAQKVLKRVRVKRNGESANTGNTSGTSQSGQTGRGGRAGGPQGAEGTYHMLQNARMGASNLVRASVLHQNSQTQNGQQPGNATATGARARMLQGLNAYVNNDYQMMKVNPDDKSFTYRTAEARQLNATIGQMLASTTRQGTNANKTNEETPAPRLSPEAFGRQKGLLRRLSAMSESQPRLPDNLPTDYRPFESVA